MKSAVTAIALLAVVAQANPITSSAVTVSTVLSAVPSTGAVSSVFATGTGVVSSVFATGTGVASSVFSNGTVIASSAFSTASAIASSAPGAAESQLVITIAIPTVTVTQFVTAGGCATATASSRPVVASSSPSTSLEQPIASSSPSISLEQPIAASSSPA